MPDPKMVTERDVVLREREAFQQGADAVFKHFLSSYSPDAFDTWEGSGPLAESRYPLPKRVVVDPHDPRISWRIGNRLSSDEYSPFEYSESRGAWRLGLGSLCVSDLRVRMWADLLANPTEEVEE